MIQREQASEGGCIMKSRWILLLVILSLLLCQFQSVAYAGTWPASGEELAAANPLDERSYWQDGVYQEPEKKWARLWVEKNYGKDMGILSVQCVDWPLSFVNAGKLLEGYRWLKTSVWKIRLKPKTFWGKITTVSIQIVSMEKEGEARFYGEEEYVLAGFLPPEETFQDLFEVHAYLQQDPRFRDSLVELRTVVPEGVTEIDLRTILGGDALDVKDAWMLSSNVCVILRTPSNDQSDQDGLLAGTPKANEIVVFDVQSRSIISRTSVPYAVGQYVISRPGWADGEFHFRFRWWESRSEDWADGSVVKQIKVIISPEGTVNVGDLTQGLHTVMPEGKTAVREGEDGSLYAVDLVTGQEELLIQGFSTQDSLSGEPRIATMYVPFWDELDHDGWDEHKDDSGIYDPDDVYFSIREFYVIEPLDEYRFVYGVSGWEWKNGFGVYDLRTRTDHRITGRGNFFGVRGGALFGSTLKADVNTYQTSTLVETVQEQFNEASQWMTNDLVYYDISPDGRLLALSGMIPRKAGEERWLGKVDTEATPDHAHTVTVTDMVTGELVKAYDIENPFARECTVTFYDDTHFMLFYWPEKLGSAYIYLFDVEK